MDTWTKWIRAELNYILMIIIEVVEEKAEEHSIKKIVLDKYWIAVDPTTAS